MYKKTPLNMQSNTFLKANCLIFPGLQMAPSIFFLKTVGKLLYTSASLLQFLTSSVKLLEEQRLSWQE